MENETEKNEADTMGFLHKVVYTLIGGLVLASITGMVAMSISYGKTEDKAQNALNLAMSNQDKIEKNNEKYMEKLADVTVQTSIIGANISGLTTTMNALVLGQKSMAKDVKQSRQWQLSRERLIDSILDRNTGKGKL